MACRIILQEVFLTKDYICIAMEYASSGNLFGYVKQAIRLKAAASRFVPVVTAWGGIGGERASPCECPMQPSHATIPVNHPMQQVVLPAAHHRAGLLPPDGRGQQGYQAREHIVAGVCAAVESWFMSLSIELHTKGGGQNQQ